MKTENLTFTHKKKTYSATVVWPENLVEAFNLLGEKDMWAAFKLGYLEITKRRIVSPTPRPRIRKIDLSRLTDDQIALLESILGESPAPVAAQKNDPPAAQQTAPIDSDEKPVVAQVSVLQRETSFEEDYSKYLAALGSSPQRRTETVVPPPLRAEGLPQSNHSESP